MRAQQVRVTEDELIVELSEEDREVQAMIIIESDHPQEVQIRVGTRNPRLPGPLDSPRGPVGRSRWTRERIRTRRGPITLYYQEITARIIENARIRVHGDIDIPCHRATREHLTLLEATFRLVPPSHLRLVNQRKPQGFLLSNTTGRGANISYMGGLNPRVDYRSTPHYNETQLILITYGALWENRDLGICPTVLHEIGHVLTHRGEINYSHFPEERRRQLAGTRTSRNPGALEALCNAYMYFLCYASSSPDVQAYGNRAGDIQRDRVTRDALRRCPAFTRLLDETWRSRFAERG
ncbi:MAG: hypothetical protein D6736_18900 [Nitrospinota bacterium]|nr:MAG: hypothetical protein D6736_18900 [Nitrospinota bacterium]